MAVILHNASLYAAVKNLDIENLDISRSTPCVLFKNFEKKAFKRDSNCGDDFYNCMLALVDHSHSRLTLNLYEIREYMKLECRAKVHLFQ